MSRLKSPRRCRATRIRPRQGQEGPCPGSIL
jgi:hypothetical protein